MKEVYGYVRVSTKEQNEDRQVLALRKRRCRGRISIWINCRARISTGPCIRSF